MEQEIPQENQFEAANITFWGRNRRPTESFVNAQAKASGKGSSMINVFGTIMECSINPENGNTRIKIAFSPDIAQRYQNGEVSFPDQLASSVDPQTLSYWDLKRKKEIKNSTKVYRKR